MISNQINTTQFTNQEVQFLPYQVPQPVLIQPNPLPLVTPVFYPVTIAPPSLMFNGTDFVTIPQELRQFDQNGMPVCPEGYSFVTMSVSPSATPSPSPSLSAAEASPSLDACEGPLALTETEPLAVDARSAEPAPKAEKQKRYPHRSKQVRILQVHETLKQIYTEKGLYAQDNEVLRGPDVVRVHVKTFQGLNKIQDALSEVEKEPTVTLERIATPFSMKNKYQKKGFIVYLKLSHESQVPAVKNIFEHRYPEHFKKCDVALPKSRTPVSKPVQDLTSLPTLTMMDDSLKWADEEAEETPGKFLRKLSSGLGA